jgi:hypothetical protein
MHLLSVRCERIYKVGIVAAMQPGGTSAGRDSAREKVAAAATLSKSLLSKVAWGCVCAIYL